jgi:RNase P subunit RPR2
MQELDIKKGQMYGPFIRANKNDKWHFCKECSHFPNISNPEIRVASHEPDVKELCQECLSLNS